MNLNEINQRLKTLKIPVAYNVFRDNPKPPYIAYYEVGGENYGADYQNFIRKRNIRIELYCKNKDTELEQNLERLFADEELSVSEEWIESEDLIRISYSFNTINRISI